MVGCVRQYRPGRCSRWCHHWLTELDVARRDDPTVDGDAATRLADIRWLAGSRWPAAYCHGYCGNGGRIRAAWRGIAGAGGDAREWGIPAYTLYLAELVRRSGGQLYFLREAETLAESYRRIAASIGGEYTLGFEPTLSQPTPASHQPAWHLLASR